MKGKEQQEDAEDEFGIAWIGNSTNLACKFSGAVGNGTIFISASTYSAPVSYTHLMPEYLSEFDEIIFDDLVEKAVVESSSCIRFKLINGVEISESLEMCIRDSL